MISITEPAWNKVAKAEMNLLWSTIKHHWNIEDDIYKVPVLKGALYSWRSFKKRLIANYLKEDRNPCDDYPYLDLATWEKICAMKTTKEFLEKSEKGRKNAMLNTNPSRLGGRPCRVMVPTWKKEMTKPSQSSKLGNLKDERARNFLLARRVKAADGTLVLPAHLQELADKIIEKDRQISQGLWVPGPGVDVLIAVLGPEHGGRTRGVGHTVGLKKGIPGILEKKRKSRTPVDPEWEEMRMAFNAECEEKTRLFAEERRLFEVECAEEIRLLAEERRSFEVECEEKRRQINDEFEEKRKLFDAHFQMCMQQMPKLDDIHVGSSGTRKSSSDLVPRFDELDGAKASKTVPISKPVAALPSTQLAPIKSSQQGGRKKTIPKKLVVPAISGISEKYLRKRPKELQALYRRWESRPNPTQEIEVHVASGVFGGQSYDLPIFRDDIHFLVKGAWLDHSTIAWFRCYYTRLCKQTRTTDVVSCIHP